MRPLHHNRSKAQPSTSSTADEEESQLKAVMQCLSEQQASCTYVGMRYEDNINTCIMPHKARMVPN